MSTRSTSIFKDPNVAKHLSLLPMTMSLRTIFGTRVVVVVDCFEIFFDRPSNRKARAQIWSSYKHNNTVVFTLSSFMP
jgi:hypothetical protein